MNRKICVITGTRAEYGLLRWVMQDIKDDPSLDLQVIATGMHLSPEFGLTYREIEADGFNIDRKVEMLTSSDTVIGIAKSMGLAMVGMADALNELKPDLIVVLGDRYEVFASVAAALVACIPVAHLHGGEITRGAFDDAFRHAITKMSHLHFVAAEEYRSRVIQLGEPPERVFLVGGLGVDSVKRLKLLNRKELELSLGFKWKSKNLLITFHPVTLNSQDSKHQLNELLSALENLNNTGLIFTLPNSDTGGRMLSEIVMEFVGRHANAFAASSLGQLRYLSCLRHVDAVIGNSSSGLTEMPIFGKGTINIGDRQEGRLRAVSVIDCLPERKSIEAALQRIYSKDFQKILKNIQSPYGEGGASGKILGILRDVSLKSITKKSFYDLDFGRKIKH